MKPLAPVLFSTTTVRPCFFDRVSAAMRAAMSAVPPGA
jgi:hypothetical protein